MLRFYPAWCLAAALLVFGPAGLRMLTWERSQSRPVEAEQAKAGAVLFKHEWRPNDPLSPGGDGLGPVFNAASCVACHHQSAPGGGGGLEHNVTMFVALASSRPGQPREGVLHARATSERYRETLALLDPGLPALSQIPLSRILPPKVSVQMCVVDPVDKDLLQSNTVLLSQRNTPALFGAKWIDEISEQDILALERRQQLRFGMAPSDSETHPVGRAARLPNGKIGRFGWKGQMASLSEFVEAACANELGLGNPTHAQPTSLAQQNYRPVSLDLTQAQCDQLTAFVADLARPMERLPAEVGAREQALAGKALFETVGCADCHTPNLGHVEGLYSDLLMHRMGTPLQGSGGGYGAPRIIVNEPTGPGSDEWRTPPLWGVADSAPYLHDGRAATLEEAIKMHGGQSATSARRFAELNFVEQAQLVAFLRTLRAR